MINTSLDVLYISLAVGFLVLVVFLCMTLLYATFILRDVSKMTEDAKEVTDKVNQIVISPLRMMNTLMEHLKPILDSVKTKVEEKQRRRRRNEDD
ncbi:MAG: DUF948 domain-containing protein [Candidatus Gracilibacteria bacterium]|nr:hypothetical protein [Candidatus Gracilibacteria bacterium]